MDSEDESKNESENKSDNESKTEKLKNEHTRLKSRIIEGVETTTMQTLRFPGYSIPFHSFKFCKR